MKKKYSETRDFVNAVFKSNYIFCNFLNINSTFTYVTCKIFLFNLFLLMKIKHEKNHSMYNSDHTAT